MDFNGIAEKYVQTIKAILLCGDNKCFEPALRLLYSAIDSLSWLYSEQMDLKKREVKKEYEKWVNDFLIPKMKKHDYECTATELYLARCSQLHTFSAIAKKQNNTRVVAYVVGDKEILNKSIQSLPEIEKISEGTKFVIIHIGDLVSSFMDGTHEFFKLIENNKELLDKAIIKADSYYVPIDRYIV
ncbi:hypothetical protein ABDB91_08810 [Desulfoscipio sp. XC116]|uniref:hypothetical protein n=1 Tax=Desulfoscipio sp. XC116 TaxID=3144975 RepID=UPI00325BF162